LGQNSWQPDTEDDRATFKTLIPLISEDVLTAQNYANFVPSASQRARAKVPGRINDLAFSPHRPLIAIGTGQGKAVLCNFEVAERVWLAEVEHSIAQITFTPDDVLLFAERSARKNSPCGVYCYRQGRVACLGRHTGPVTALEGIDATHFLTTGRDGKIVTWDLTGPVTEMAVTDDWPRSACVSVDGQRAGVLTKQMLILCELPALTRLTSTRNEGKVLRQATFAADGQTLILSRASEVFTAHYRDKKLNFTDSPLIRHSGAVQGLEMARNRTPLITADAKGQINFIHWPHQVSLGQIQVPGRRLTSLHVSPDGSFMAVGDSDASFSLWDLRALSLPILLNQPLGQARPTHLSWLLTLLKIDKLPPQALNTLHYIEAVLRHRFRYDIEISEGPEILAGEFDIELE
jgi:WD40 repeat protein